MEIAMGYCTTYTLNCYNCTDEEMEDFKKELYEVSGHNRYVDDFIDEGFISGVSHFPADEWIASIAGHFPNMLIVLDGKGEDDMDVWQMRYKNGKVFKQTAILYPPLEDKQFLSDSEIKFQEQFNRQINNNN